MAAFQTASFLILRSVLRMRAVGCLASQIHKDRPLPQPSPAERERELFLMVHYKKGGSKVNDKHLHSCFLFLILYINSLFYVNV
ncbi:hypothetical protein NEISICOT_00487 [Neisseria sicca ATCC 29256]|uniref:Uncharacterized protein n=1 Tax=Neisseria sicca ATCC 29256 TaxID=547045 RepID=C6M1V0_NEISI|nr:hypothetical protein NEISICOT_00487 [Neisseria sicca ATCC 29256]